MIEGQATYEQTYLMSGGSGNIAAQLPGGWEKLREAIRDAQQTQPIFSSAPLVIQESLLFPYINGAEFVRRFKQRRPGTLPFDSMPASSEQLMHGRAFFDTLDVPSEVVLPALSDKIDENNFGEFGTRLFVFQHVRDQNGAIRASNGWDGDRYALVKRPAGNSLVWVSVWDAPLDAAEFVSSIDDVMRERFNVRAEASGEIRRFRTSRRTVEVSSRTVDGRSVVFYVDVPAGESTSFVDLSKVRVTAK